MRHKQKAMLKMIILPAIYTVIFLIIYLIAGNDVVMMAVDDIRNMWIVSAPSFEYEEGVQEETHTPLAGQQYGEIICEELEFRVPLYYGDSEKELKYGAGTWIGSALPGKEGVSLIGGHDTTYFKALEQVKAGQEIKVKTTYGEFIYHVAGTEVKKASQFKLEEVKDGTKLVLYTCYPFGAVGETREERFFVYVEE